MALKSFNTSKGGEIHFTPFNFNKEPEFKKIYTFINFDVKKAVELHLITLR